MKTVKDILWILLTITCSTCGNGQKTNKAIQIIDIESNMNNLEIINLSQFASNLKYVPLKTNGNTYISYISECAFYANFILVTNLKQCLLYDYEGNLITTVGKEGRGPGEYQFVSKACFNNDTNIYMQSLRDLIEYRIDGSFMKKIKNRFMFNNSMYEYTRNWIIINDSLLFSHIPNPTGNIKYKALLTNDDGEIIKSYANHILFSREKPISSSVDNANIYQFDKMIYFKEFYNDTLFYLDSQYNLIPKYVFNFGKYKEPVSEREKPVREIGLSMSKYLYVSDVFQTDKNLYLSCKFGDHFPAKRLTPKIITLPNGEVVKGWINTDRALGIYNKKTKRISFCSPTSTDNPLYTSGLYNDIDAGPRFFPNMQVNDSTMVMWIKASELKDHIESDDFKNNVAKYPEKKNQLKELGNTLSAFDNPVLMFLTFKK